MKKTILILAIIVIAAPVWAAVTITATHEGCGVVRIDYTNTEPNKVRAFALDVSVSDGNIIDINDYTEGESNAVNKGYGIFPATIDVNLSTDYVDKWGSPVADINDPNTAGELGSNAITLEMGALYSPTGDTSPNSPNNTGTLCRITVNDNCTVNISANAKRGGVVLTNGNSVSPSYTPIGVVKYTGSDLAVWRSVGRPDCWCAGCGYTRQCHGDADNQTGGDDKEGYYYVGGADLQLLVDAYQIREPAFGPGIGSLPNGICADFAHDLGGDDKEGYYRVGGADLQILVNYWQIREDPFGPGTDPNCP